MKWHHWIMVAAGLYWITHTNPKAAATRTETVTPSSIEDAAKAKYGFALDNVIVEALPSNRIGVTIELKTDLMGSKYFEAANVGEAIKLIYADSDPAYK